MLKILDIALISSLGGEEEKAYQKLKDLSNTVENSVEIFKKATKAYSDLDYERGGRLQSELDKLESKADQLGYEFKQRLGEGVFLPNFRRDLSHLAESVDDIADMANHSIMEISHRPELFEEIRNTEEENPEMKEIRKGLIEISDLALKSTSTLNEAVSVLLENMDEASEIVEEVHRQEKKSDDKEHQIIGIIYGNSDLLKPVSLIQIRKVIESFGGISDAAEKSGDRISSMVSALKV